MSSKADPVPTVIVPGWGGSEPAHWQSILERELGAQRIPLADWQSPTPAAWVAALDAAITRSKRPPVLVGHSLGCIVIAHWAARWKRPVRGALLVAPADIEVGALTLETFLPVPQQALPFRSIVVASDNDPYVPLDRAKAMARQWSSSLWLLEKAGHINVASGHGAWPLAHSLLAQLQVPALSSAARSGAAAGIARR